MTLRGYKGKLSARQAKTARRPRAAAVLLAAVMLLSFLPVSGARAEEGTGSVSGFPRPDANGDEIYDRAETPDTPAGNPAPLPDDADADEDATDGLTETGAHERPEEAPQAPGGPTKSSSNGSLKIDLSDDTGWATDAGYTMASVNGDGQAPYILSFTADADGLEYRITQQAETASLVRNIVVETGVETVITIAGISLETDDAGVPLLALQGTANVTLLLKGTNVLKQSADSNGNNAALYVPEGTAVTIDDSGGGDGVLDAAGGFIGAAIGGGRSGQAVGAITLAGGTVIAQGGRSAAGIGGGYHSIGGTITIGGGTVNATGGQGSPGIGAGEGGDDSVTVTIISGTVTATGGVCGAGIGGGWYGTNYISGTITISGGTVTATGGGDLMGEANAEGSNCGGAGIGGGYRGVGGTITITGGTVIAQGAGDGAGIGGGSRAGGDTTISGGKVTATGGRRAAGIGGGNGGAGGNIIISGSADVTAESPSGGAGIGGGSGGAGTGSVTIAGSAKVTAIGGEYAAGIGGGWCSVAYPGGGGTVNITGNADVTAIGGRNPGAAFAAGIGSGHYAGSPGAVLTIDATAKVKAYSQSGVRPAIHAESYSGGAYLVNAALEAGSVSASERTLSVSGGGEAEVFTLPAGYACFAYTTGGAARNDQITVNAGGIPSGRIFLDGSSSTQLLSANTAALTGVAITPFDAIDLSDAATWTGTGYTVSAEPRVLTFGTGASGQAYYIYQTGDSLIRNIAVATNVTGTMITINGIDLTSLSASPISLSGNAELTLTLEGDNSLTQGGVLAALNAPAGTTLTISGTGRLEAQGGTTAAGIGSSSGSAGGNITITGDTVVVAQGGSNGAGIGGASGRAGGTIRITGNANVTATGGLGGGKNTSGAGIGPGYADTVLFCNLTIDASATVRAYAYYSKTGAIQIGSAGGSYSGTGYFINASFGTANTGLPDSGGTRLDVYAEGSAVRTNTLILPEGYNAFAYTTGRITPQSDHILAYAAATGDILGSVLLNTNAQEIGPSVRNNDRSQVKLGSSPGTPSVSDVSHTGAAFTSIGHALREATFINRGFGFAYATIPDMSVAASVPAGLSTLPSATTPISVTLPENTLEANTRYYLSTWLVTSAGSYISGALRFATRPRITSAEAGPGADAAKALISARFYESMKNNADIAGVTVYWDTAAIDADNPDSVIAANSAALANGQFNNAGFDDFALAGLTPGTAYNILIVAENEDGRKDARPLIYSGSTTLTVSNSVTGEYADTTKTFTFTVTFMDADGTPLPEGTAFSCTGGAIEGATPPEDATLTLGENGEADFKLRHGQSLIIAGAAANGKVRITQTKAPLYDKVSFTDSENLEAVIESNDTGAVDMTENARTFAFVNARDDVPLTGLGAGDVGAALLLPGLALLLLTALYALRKRRRSR
jgi:hypothetical protein